LYNYFLFFLNKKRQYFILYTKNGNVYSNLKTLNIIEDSERSILQRFCVAVHNQNVWTFWGMAGGWGGLS